MTQQEFDSLPEISAMEMLKKDFPEAFYQFKDIYMQLHRDAFDKDLITELAEFILENPIPIEELDRKFRKAYNI
jgi:hypothetical protein